MIFTGKCPRCKREIKVEGKPMPPENCDGREGFYEIDTICPECGFEIETVLGR